LGKSSQNKDWIRIKSHKKLKDAPSEIKISMNGNVYIDGELFDPDNNKYACLTVDVEKHNRMNLGEETQKIIESSKSAKKGEVVTIKDLKGPDRTESTTVKF
jgi:hypothetical protein